MERFADLDDKGIRERKSFEEPDHVFGLARIRLVLVQVYRRCNHSLPTIWL